MFYTYMIRCKDNSLYTGITTDIKRRFEEHSKKTSKCAKYTLNHQAEKIECAWQSETRVLASRLEFYIKKLNKQEKENLIKDNKLFRQLLSKKLTCKLYKRVVFDEKYEMKEKIFEFLRIIPKKKVVTYKQIAEFLGNEKLARVVGNYLHKNPDEKRYPCYKVVNSQGKLASNFAFGGIDGQKEKLEREGIEVVGYCVDLKKYQWDNKKCK